MNMKSGIIRNLKVSILVFFLNVTAFAAGGGHGGGGNNNTQHLAWVTPASTVVVGDLAAEICVSGFIGDYVIVENGYPLFTFQMGIVLDASGNGCLSMFGLVTENDGTSSPNRAFIYPGDYIVKVQGYHYSNYSKDGKAIFLNVSVIP